MISKTINMIRSLSAHIDNEVDQVTIHQDLIDARDEGGLRGGIRAVNLTGAIPSGEIEKIAVHHQVREVVDTEEEKETTAIEIETWQVRALAIEVGDQEIIEEGEDDLMKEKAK